MTQLLKLPLLCMCCIHLKCTFLGLSMFQFSLPGKFIIHSLDTRGAILYSLQFQFSHGHELEVRFI